MSVRVVHKRGDTWLRDFVCTSGSVPADLTGCTVRLQLRASAEEETAALDISTEDGEITIEQDADECVIHIDVGADVTELIEPLTYVADMEITWPDGTVESTETIKWVVEADVTRAEEEDPAP